MAGKETTECTVSDWVDFSQKELLLGCLKPGDRIEFERSLYCHWAIFIGREYRDGLLYYKIAHRTHPTYADGEVPLYMIASTSVPASAKTMGVGAIEYDDILTVWTNGRARKNNTLDSKAPPRSPREILELIEIMVTDPVQNRYNLLSENCEHFASFARNDTRTSQQVDNAFAFGGAIVGGLLLGAGIMAVAKALDRSKESDDEEEPSRYRYGM